nr:hemicentin-1-like isoform X1 [Dermatophagoides farinae]
MVNNCNNNNNNNIIINCHHAMIIIRQQQQQQQRSVATKMMMLLSLSRNKNTMIGYHHRSHYKSIRSVMPYSGHLLISMILFCLFIRTIYTDSGGTLTINSQHEDQRVMVKGIAQQSASLPCYIDEENCGAIYFLTWSRLDSREDRWSRIWVYSDDNVNKALSSLTGRAIFTKQKSEARLVINSLKPSDEAFYKCDVTYVAGKCPSLTYVQLNIIAKPSRSWIEHEGDILSNGHHLSLTEGDYLKLACTVIDARPTPIIIWRSVDSRGQTNELIRSTTSSGSDSFIVTTGTSGDDINSNARMDRATLILNKKLSRDDLGSKYECHIEHETIGNGTMDKHVVLDVSVGIKTMEIIGPSTSVREGDIAVIECVAYGSKPAAEIVWRNGSRIIDGHSIQNTIETNIDRITVNSRSKLEIIVGHQDHLNPITCEAANVAMRTPINKSTEISVLFAPIVVMEPQNGVTVNESTPMVKIYCTYLANPSQLLENETIWFKDGRRLDISDRSRYIIESVTNSPTLVIMDVTRNDTGHYHCTLANTFGSGVPNSSIYLNVLYPPIVSLFVYPNPSSSDYLLKEGDDLRMVCDIHDGNPRSASRMRWLKNNGETFSELDGDTSTQKELSWLSIPRSLTGNYTCQAISEAGASELSNEIEIIVHYPPGKSIIRLLDEPHPIKGRNLTLECIVNDYGSPSDHTEYHWENSDGMVFESRQPILTIQNVRIVNRGNISCSAVNEVGFGARGQFELIPYAPPRFINPLPATIGVNEDFRSSSSLESSYMNYNQNEMNTATWNTHAGNGQTYGYVTGNELNGLRPSSSDSSDLITLYCRVECFPLCSLHWYRNDQPIDNGTKSEYRIIEEQLPEEFLLNRFPGIESTLTWNISKSGRSKLDRVRDSGTTFSCVSSGNLVGPSIRSDSRFQVEYAPENLRLSSIRVDVIENEHLPEIRCDSDALPEATYRWISNSFYDKFTGVIADTPILALNRTIQRDSAGTYTCIASNRHGEKRIDLQINVLYRPSCTIYESRTGKENQDVVLICEITFANPSNGLEFFWSLNGTELNQTFIDELSHQDGMKSKIIIPAYEEQLFGTWTCSARNTVGQTDPNCTLFVDAPIAAESVLDDESLLIISAVIVAIIFAFLFILLCLIFMMKRRRHKNDKDKRENPDGDRSPTPSSSTSRVSSNQNDLISQKSQASSKKATETERLSSSNSSTTATMPTSGDMYENMTFHRKPNCLPHLNGMAASYYHHHNPMLPQSSPITATPATTSSISPIPPTYDNATKTLNNTIEAFRRTQSARFTSNQNLGLNIYSIYNDPSQALMYTDLKLPPPPIATKPMTDVASIANHHNHPAHHQNHSQHQQRLPTMAKNHTLAQYQHHHPITSFHSSTLAKTNTNNMYQQLGPMIQSNRTSQHYPNHVSSSQSSSLSSSNNNNNNQQNNGSSSDSSTPPSLSTSSTNSNHYNVTNSTTTNKTHSSSGGGGGGGVIHSTQIIHHTSIILMIDLIRSNNHIYRSLKE